MGLENFYKVLTKKEISDNQLKLVDIEVNKDHEVFSGHFPGNPVMPGVCMMHIIKEITESYIGQTLFMEHCSNVKFMSIINPQVDNKIQLELKISNEGEHIVVKSQTRFQQKVALKMSVRYKPFD